MNRRTISTLTDHLCVQNTKIREKGRSRKSPTERSSTIRQALPSATSQHHQKISQKPRQRQFQLQRHQKHGSCMCNKQKSASRNTRQPFFYTLEHIRKPLIGPQVYFLARLRQIVSSLMRVLGFVRGFRLAVLHHLWDSSLPHENPLAVQRF